jgi:hypothetical protein
MTVKKDDRPARIGRRHEPRFERHATAARENVPLIGESKVARRSTVLRSGHFGTRYEHLDLLAEREELGRWRSVTWRREANESSGVPIGDPVHSGDRKEQHRAKSLDPR